MFPTFLSLSHRTMLHGTKQQPSIQKLAPKIVPPSFVSVVPLTIALDFLAIDLIS